MEQRGRLITSFIISKVRELKRSEELLEKEEKQETLQESGGDQKKIEEKKGIVKRLILLNCSLILAPEKDPRG